MAWLLTAIISLLLKVNPLIFNNFVAQCDAAGLLHLQDAMEENNLINLQDFHSQFQDILEKSYKEHRSDKQTLMNYEIDKVGMPLLPKRMTTSFVAIRYLFF